MRSARPRLVLLYLLAAGPLLLLLALGAWMDRASALDNARQQAEAVARIGAQQHGDLIRETQNVLTLLTLVPEVREAGPGCNATLRRITALHPRIININVGRPDGSVACNGRELVSATQLQDRPYFKRALAALAGEAVGSEIMTSRVTGRPAMVVAAPVRDTAGDPVDAVLTATLNMDWMPWIAESAGGDGGTLVQLVDVARGQAVLQADSDGVRTIAGAVDPALQEAMRAQPQGGSAAATMNGATYTVGFAPMPGMGTQLMLAAGVPKSETLAASNYHLTLNALGFLAAAIAAVMLAWLAADHSLLRPIRRLAAAAAVIGEGNLGTCVGELPGAVDELKTLAGSLDAMAARLRARDERIAALGASIAQSEEHHRLLANNAGDMIARFDRDFTRTYISPACREVMGYEPAAMVGEAMPGVVLKEDQARLHAELMSPLLLGGDTARCTYRAVRRDGRTIWLETFGRRLPDGSGFVTVARDVSIQKELEAQLEAANQQLRVQVMQDPLTGIANRRRFDEMLGFEYQRSQRLHEPLSLLMIDIDHFKQFNDTYGHPVGDECLRRVAHAMDKTLRRPGDLVGRYGGEEFAVLLPGTPLAGAVVISERIRLAVSHLTIAGADEAPTVSIGGATILPPIDTDGPADLVRSADTALYQAKRDGRDCVKMATANRTLAPARTE